MADDNMKVLAKTEAGKEIAIRSCTTKGMGGLYEICFTSGGEVPECLKGAFSNASQALAVIDNYLVNIYKQKKPQKTTAKSKE